MSKKGTVLLSIYNSFAFLMSCKSYISSYLYLQLLGLLAKALAWLLVSVAVFDWELLYNSEMSDMWRLKISWSVCPASQSGELTYWLHPEVTNSIMMITILK